MYEKGNSKNLKELGFEKLDQWRFRNSERAKGPGLSHTRTIAIKIKKK